MHMVSFQSNVFSYLRVATEWIHTDRNNGMKPLILRGEGWGVGWKGLETFTLLYIQGKFQHAPDAMFLAF